MVRQARRGSYSPLMHGRPTQFSDASKITKPDIDVKILRPRWAGASGPLPVRSVYRILPVPDPENPGNLVPTRRSDAPGDFGPWIYGCYMAQNIGTSRLTFVIGDHRDIDDWALQQSPVYVLWQRLSNAYTIGESDPTWGTDLVKVGRESDSGRQPLVSRPQFGQLVQAVVYSHAAKPQDRTPYGLAEDEPLVIVPLTWNASMSLMQTLDNCVDVLPDLTALDQGLFVDIHAAHAPPPGVTLTNEQQQERGYVVTLLNAGPPYGSPSLRSREAEVHAKVKWWDDVIWIPTVEEQVQWICESGLPPTAICYALRDRFGNMIPNEIYERADAMQGQRSTPTSYRTATPAQHEQISPMRSQVVHPPVTSAPPQQGVAFAQQVAGMDLMQGLPLQKQTDQTQTVEPPFDGGVTASAEDSAEITHPSTTSADTAANTLEALKRARDRRRSKQE